MNIYLKKDCTKCIHSSVCKFRNEYKKLKDIDEKDAIKSEIMKSTIIQDINLKLEVDCRHYDEYKGGW